MESLLINKELFELVPNYCCCLLISGFEFCIGQPNLDEKGGKQLQLCVVFSVRSLSYLIKNICIIYKLIVKVH